VSNSSRPKQSKLAKKPREDFPLFPHATGRWAKKVRGKLKYFGKTAVDPQGAAALKLWLDQKDDLLAGRTPRTSGEGLTVAALANSFLTSKAQQRDAGELAPRSFTEYFSSADRCGVRQKATGGRLGGRRLRDPSREPG
jgi:hypothetical protein